MRKGNREKQEDNQSEIKMRSKEIKWMKVWTTEEVEGWKLQSGSGKLKGFIGATWNFCR